MIIIKGIRSKIMLNKADLISAVADRTGESKATTERFLGALQDVIIETVAKGEEVRLTGFAAFDSAQRAARQMKNPRTGEAIQVPATRVVKIRPLKRFQDEVKGN